LTKAKSEDFENALDRFKNRYLRVLDSDCVVAIPDNPLGNLHFTATEIISYLELAVDPESLLIHLNSFHRKIDLDEFLSTCSEPGVKYLLCVSGDGSPRLPRLEPADLAMNCNTVTTVELIKYIHAEHPGRFTYGLPFCLGSWNAQKYRAAQ
jgi:methylenetetrahydrofolate reductase (NADPH)